MAIELLGMVLWGIGMGAQESIIKAALAEMVPRDRRATGYGIFNTGFGLFWFLGSALMGILIRCFPGRPHRLFGDYPTFGHPLLFAGLPGALPGAAITVGWALGRNAMAE